MKHLDIGCGRNPRNPYKADELFGIDITPDVCTLGANFKCANLVVGGIPFESNFFDSISAFDVLEHIPRQAVDFQAGVVKLPFIELMNEVWRTLNGSGMFYAFTPAYPGVPAFQDPTHVNFITERTHDYFCGPDAYAKRYGFVGEFALVEAQWMYSRYAETAARSRKIAIKNWHKQNVKPGKTHIVWQFRAVK